MIRPTVREPAHGLFVYGLVVICALAAADLLGLPGGASVGQIMLLLGLPFWANAMFARRGTLFDPAGKSAVTIILTCTMALAALALFSATYADQPIRVARVILTMLSSLAMFTFLCGTLTKARVFPLIATLAGALSLVSVLTIVAYLVPPLKELIFLTVDRAPGTFKNPNQYGIVISTVAPITAGLFFAARGQLRLFAFACLLLLLTGLLLSGSKANLLLTGSSLALFALILGATSFRGVERTFVISLSVFGILVALILGAVLLHFLNPRALMLITVFFDPNQTLPTLDSRRELWTDSIAIFMANPWLGEGAGQYLRIAIDGEVISHSHNLFIEYARTLGAAGLVFITVLALTIIVMLTTTVLRLFNRDFAQPRTRALLVGAAISSANYIFANFSSESFGPSTSPFFWLVLSLFFILRGEILKNKAQRTPPPRLLVPFFKEKVSVA